MSSLGIGSLPTSLVRQFLLPRLSAATLCGIAQASQKWREWADIPSLWSRLCQQDWAGMQQWITQIQMDRPEIPINYRNMYMRRKIQTAILNSSHEPKPGDAVVEPQVVSVLPEREYWVWSELVQRTATTGDVKVLASEIHCYNQTGLDHPEDHYFGAHWHLFSDDAQWRLAITEQLGTLSDPLELGDEQLLKEAFSGVCLTFGLLRSDGEIAVLAGSACDPEQLASNRCDLPQSDGLQDLVSDDGDPMLFDLPFVARGFHRVNTMSVDCAQGAGYCCALSGEPLPPFTYIETFLPVLMVVGHMSIRKVEHLGYYEWVLHTVGFDLWPINRDDYQWESPIDIPIRMLDLIQTSLSWPPFSQP